MSTQIYTTKKLAQESTIRSSFWYQWRTICDSAPWRNIWTYFCQN